MGEEAKGYNISTTLGEAEQAHKFFLALTEVRMHVGGVKAYYVAASICSNDFMTRSYLTS